MIGDRTFSTASDEALTTLIAGAERRLVIIAPALTSRVAEALTARFLDLDRLAITLILDADPEVYRLGYGDETALQAIREASQENLFELREQQGIRIGVVVADETTMIYAPVPRMIEAGSTSVEKPNAIVITGSQVEKIATAAGAGANEYDRGPQEVGLTAITPTKIAELESDLRRNPIQPFDISRALRIFNSKVQYVELEVLNYKLSTRRVKLPSILLGFSDDDLRERVSSNIKAPFASASKIKVEVSRGGKTETLELDDKWLTAERKRIEDRYTYAVPNYGRVIFHDERAEFEAEIAAFERLIHDYRDRFVSQISDEKEKFVNQIVQEFAPKWENSPPAKYSRFKIEMDSSEIESELRKIAEDLFDNAICFEEPKIRLVPKNIAPESVRDEGFFRAIQDVMRRKDVPERVIRSLFGNFDAAPSKSGRLSPEFSAG